MTFVLPIACVESKEQGCHKDRRHNTDWNKFKHQRLFGFLFYLLKLHLSRTVGGIITRGAVSESLEYDISCPRSIGRTSMNPTNRSVAKIENAKLTEKVQTSEPFGICVLSFEASLLEKLWWDTRKWGTLESLECNLFGSENFTYDANCQQERQLVKSWGHNTEKNENQTSCFEK